MLYDYTGTTLVQYPAGLAGSYTGENSNIPTFKTAAGQEQFFSYANTVSFNGEQSHLNPEANYYWGPLGLYG